MKFIFKTFLYFIYVLITMDARNRYLAGKAKGMNCYKITSGFGCFTNHFENKPPQRDYLTWKEFREEHNF